MSSSPQGSGGTSASNNETMEDLIKELNKAILALRTLIEREYPNRREIEAKFVNKTTWDHRLRLILVTILFASLLSFLGTTALMAKCFLGATRPDACAIIPGFESNEIRRTGLYDDIEDHNKRLKRIEDELGIKDDPNDRLDRIERKLGIKDPS
jgi:hypothetical protein